MSNIKEVMTNDDDKTDKPWLPSSAIYIKVSVYTLMT